MKALRIAGKILLNTLVVLLVVLLLLHLGVTAIYFDYFLHSKGEFVVPGLDTPFVPQGFDYLPDTDSYLISGYMSDDTAARVYVRDGEGNIHFVSLLRPDGSAYVEHAGGVCHNGDYLYVAGPTGVDVFSLADALAGRDPVQLGTIATGYPMAYCSFYNGYLLTGDFYYPETYETPAAHRFTTPAGDANMALMTVFKADETALFGIHPEPVAAISTPGKVQGLCFSEDEIILSTSYGFATSYLHAYRFDESRQGIATVLGQQVPLYYLDSANRTVSVSAPPMAEELVYKDGRVYVLNESACNKYIYGKFIRGYQIFAYEMEGDRD
ncbi:MAG: hypothetical protein IJV82_02415 [Oscillospiraceae bacterium]|nr:hypothetical protein [Oscillospiraceae bacterium]